MTGPTPELTPEQFAQELIDRAWEEEDEVERVRLVLRALAHSPDHADGYVLLAQQVDDDLIAVRALQTRPQLPLHIVAVSVSDRAAEKA